MNSASRPGNPHAPRPIERLQGALLRAAVWALLFSLGCVLIVVLVGVVGVGGGTAERFPDFRHVAPAAGLVFVTLFVVLTPTLFFLSTRRMQDRAFTIAGVVATFFGLTMLIVFLATLAVDVVLWFEQTPRLIERANQALVDDVRQSREKLAQIMKDRDGEIAKIDADASRTPAEKKAARAALDQLLDPVIQDAQLTLEDHQRAALRDIRRSTSPPALLWYFLTHGPEPIHNPQDAGIWYALLGSLWVTLTMLLFAVPVGVGAAIYLEEYRANTWLSRLIQLNINNLAGVPSVVYGILGSFVFVGLIFRPLDSSTIAARNVLGGGLTLGLLTLPVIIVAAQEAIRAVPASIRQGAIALGATRWQTTWRTVLPMSLPGILTGTILSLSRAIGEAAPLILFGALLYVAQEPSLFGRFTVLPMQIFAWASRPPTAMPDGTTVEAWRGNAAMASVMLLLTLLAINALAIYLRHRAQKHARYD
jgi:phosphate transport system permease protein